MSGSQRLGRWALALAMSATAVGLGTALPAAADDHGGAVTTESEEDCVVSYVSRGRAVVGGPFYAIPYESVAGAPYVEDEINSRPANYGVASNAFEGFIGDIVLGTSGVYPRNITTAKAHWPPVPHSPNGGSYGTKSSTSFGPFAASQVEAGPRQVTSQAMLNGDASSPFGPARAFSKTLFDGKVLKGVDTVVGYDLRLGPVTIDKMHSVVEYETDGTSEGTKATWKLVFSGVGGDNTVYTITKDGFAPQGGDPQGGGEQVGQFNDGSDQFADALESAGIGRSSARIAEGEVTVNDGELSIRTAGLRMGMAFSARDGQIGHDQGWVFGFHDRYATVERGSCGADVNGVELDTYEDPEDGSHEYGPVRFPDPTPPGYGGPESTTPVPGGRIAPVLMPVDPETTPVLFRPVGGRYARNCTAVA